MPLEEGDPRLGCKVLRGFGKKGRFVGTFVKWLPAGDDPVAEPALYRIQHEDGDEEDLEADELEEAIEAYEKVPSKRSSGRVSSHQPFI